MEQALQKQVEEFLRKKKGKMVMLDTHDITKKKK